MTPAPFLPLYAPLIAAVGTFKHHHPNGLYLVDNSSASRTIRKVALLDNPESRRRTSPASLRPHDVEQRAELTIQRLHMLPELMGSLEAVSFRCLSLSTSLPLPCLQLDLKWPLFPHNKRPLLVVPVVLPRHQVKIKSPKDPREDEPHLGYGQILADAVTHPVAEGLKRRLIIIGKSGLV